MSMIRSVKPKTARSKRALAAREPQLVENEKTAIFVRGEKVSESVREAMKDLVSRLGGRPASSGCHCWKNFCIQSLMFSKYWSRLSTHSSSLIALISTKRTQSTPLTPTQQTESTRLNSLVVKMMHRCLSWVRTAKSDQMDYRL